MSRTETQESFGRFDFVGKIGLMGGFSLLMVVASLIFIAFKGISYGIDFKGGTEIQVKFANPVSIDQVRTSVGSLGLGDVGVQAFGEGNEFIIRFQGEKGATDKETNEKLNESIAKVRDHINTDFSAAGADIRRVDTVGPQVGAELKRNGFLAVFYCLLVILIYVAIRFDYKYSPGAVVCLIHDVIITLAIFILVGKEVNVPILAAMLTLIGYSLNDTIVVFDRIRETETAYKTKGMAFIINKAINDMFIRTLITSGTVFISALCLYIFAGGVVSDIAFAICVGVLFGTYSSIYVASPFIMIVEKLSLAPRKV
ncbi:MAG: protein-export membrane protein SecF [Bdellovibrionales bacterium RIFCSPHIGHO2_01_FULL_40_29]|nr:MAG: protein-export membrane protein SecF [Bdellovibrionales bacterium RIFCSPHIGHO2_01_FULL_40_29]OFZ34428.1 MAG: protein-export membrane protein SecF [Bdellovibrionales bacterium RIFCSPHIGHO2_02_FULL_40_15]